MPITTKWLRTVLIVLNAIATKPFAFACLNTVSFIFFCSLGLRKTNKTRIQSVLCYIESETKRFPKFRHDNSNKKKRWSSSVELVMFSLCMHSWICMLFFLSFSMNRAQTVARRNSFASVYKTNHRTYRIVIHRLLQSNRSMFSHSRSLVSPCVHNCISET